MTATASVINCLGSTEITVNRFSTGRLVGGKLKASFKKPFVISAKVQPVGGREREFLPEGWRQRYLKKFYTEIKLLASDDQKKQRADLLTFDGEDFEVMSVEQRKGLDLDHFKVFVARRND